MVAYVRTWSEKMIFENVWKNLNLSETIQTSGMISEFKISKVSFDISIIIDISSLSIDLFIWYLHLQIVLPTGRARFRRDSQSSEMVSIFRQSILWVDSSSNLIVLCIYWKVWYNLESTVLLTPSGDVWKGFLGAKIVSLPLCERGERSSLKLFFAPWILRFFRGIWF